MKDIPLFTPIQFNVIAAIDINGGISKHNQIPWYFPDDFKHFKKLTNNGYCLMGRNTYEEINKKMSDKGKDQVLPNRTSFVLSHTLTDLPNATVVKSVEEAIKLVPYDGVTKRNFWFIGGPSIFSIGLSYSSNAYMTLINDQYDCDCFFPYEQLQRIYRCTYDITPAGIDPKLRFTQWSW